MSIGSQRRSRRPTSTRSRAASTRWPRPASSGRCWRSSRRAFSDYAEAATTCDWLLDGLRGLSAGGRAAASLVERRRRPRPRRCSARTAPRGCRSTSRSSSRRSARISSAGTSDGSIYLRLHGRNAAEWWKHEESEDRYNYLYSEEELAPIADKARARARRQEEGVPLHEQPLLGAGGRQRHDAEEDAGRAGHGADAGRARRALSRCSTGSSLLCPAHGYSDDAIGVRAACRRRPCRAITLPNTAYSPSRRGCRRQRDVELAVGLAGVAGVRHRRPRRARAGASSMISATPTGVPLPHAPHSRPPSSCRASADRPTGRRSPARRGGRAGRCRSAC